MMISIESQQTAANIKCGEMSLDRYHSVAFRLKDPPYLYHFKLYHNFPYGELLIKKDSQVMNNIKPGDILRMKYYQHSCSYPVTHKTKVGSIQEQTSGKYKGYYLVGLKLLRE